MKKLTKKEIQQRIIQKRKPLDLNKFTWEAKKNELVSEEDDLHISAQDIESMTICVKNNCSITGVEDGGSIYAGDNCRVTTSNHHILICAGNELEAVCGDYCTIKTLDNANINCGDHGAIEVGKNSSIKNGIDLALIEQVRPNAKECPTREKFLKSVDSFRDCDFRGWDFSGITLQGKSFERCDFRLTKVSSIENCYFSDNDFTGKELIIPCTHYDNYYGELNIFRSTTTPVSKASRMKELDDQISDLGIDLVKRRLEIVDKHLDIEQKKNRSNMTVEEKEENDYIINLWLDEESYLQERADVDAKNNNGWTALMMASVRDYLEVVEYLESVIKNRISTL